jgi:HEAT repeat protein
LERLVDSLDGKVDLWTGKTEMDGREYEDARQAAVAAFAASNMAAVLRVFKARGWSKLHIALSGIGRVPDRRVVPYLLSAYESDEPLDRRSAVNFLAGQRDARATEALIRALSDRSFDVRRAAIDGLGEAGDARAIEPLRLLSKQSARSPRLAESAVAAIRKLRRKGT